MTEATDIPTSKQGDTLLWIAAAVLLAIAIAWFVVSKLGSGGTGTGALAVTAGPELAVPTPELAASATRAPRTNGSDTARLGPSLDNPLRAAQMAFEAGMLTEPESYSAWALFGAALDAEPANAAARDGLEQVAAALLIRGASAVEQGRYADASAIAERILGRIPDHDGAAGLESSIAEAEARQQAREAARVAAPAVRAEQPSAPRAGGVEAPRLDLDADRPAAPPGPSPGELLDRFRSGFESAVASNELLAPRDQSAKHYLLEMRRIAADDERTQTAASWLITEMLNRSTQAGEATDWAAAETWLDEAEALGAPTAALVEHRSALVSRMAAAETAKRLPVSELVLVRYVPPAYPRTALSRGIEGWVDIDFRVTSGGTTTGITVTDSSHERMFSEEAVEAVRQWTFEPRTFMGRTIDQNTYARVRFVLSSD